MMAEVIAPHADDLLGVIVCCANDVANVIAHHVADVIMHGKARKMHKFSVFSAYLLIFTCGFKG